MIPSRVQRDGSREIRNQLMACAGVSDPTNLDRRKIMKNHPTRKCIPFLFLALGLCLPLLAATSEDTPKLKKALELYPAADADKDGILTLEEATAFRDKELAGKPKAKNVAAATAPEGGERIIYKKVGDVELALYVFKPEGLKADSKVPAIVFFFGGGWSSGSPAQFEHQCKHLEERGLVAVTAI